MPQHTWLRSESYLQRPLPLFILHRSTTLKPLFVTLIAENLVKKDGTEILSTIQENLHRMEGKACIDKKL